MEHEILVGVTFSIPVEVAVLLDGVEVFEKEELFMFEQKPLV